LNNTGQNESGHGPSQVDRTINAIVFDLGDTLIYEVDDSDKSLDQIELILTPGVSDLLGTLHARGFKLGLLSNTEQTTTPQLRNALRKLGIDGLFDAIVTSSDLVAEGIFASAKPAKPPFRRILQCLGATPYRSVMVGDTVGDDVEGAIRNGINAILYQPDGQEPLLLDHDASIGLATISTFDELEHRIKIIEEANHHYSLAETAVNSYRYAEAAILFGQVGELSCEVNDRGRASSVFARAAIAREHTELWRSISAMWFQTGQCLDRSTKLESSRRYSEYDLSEHHYPSISAEQWDRVPIRERGAKAYRYAGYHAQNTNSPQDAYLLYRLSADRYERLAMYEQAAEVMVDACVSFIKEYGELSDDFFEQLLRLLSHVPISIVRMDIGVLYLKEIAGTLSALGNSKRSDQLLIMAYGREATIFKKRRRYLSYLLYEIWGITSLYGTSLRRWAIWTLALSLLVFPFLLWSCRGLVGSHPGFEYLYIGFLGFTPSGPPEIDLSTTGKVIVSLEVTVGYVFTAVLATLLLRKVSR
jgi:phosphoglycolate phosphatase-like HAD superfamily hydrolase